MSKKNASRDKTPEAKPTNDGRDGVSLVRFLLSTFVELYTAGEPCALGLLDCIADFRRRHGITINGAAGRKSGLKLSLPTIIRQLRYAQAEARETFNDRRCAAALGECIAGLTDLRDVSRDSSQRGCA